MGLIQEGNQLLKVEAISVATFLVQCPKNKREKERIRVLSFQDLQFQKFGSCGSFGFHIFRIEMWRPRPSLCNPWRFSQCSCQFFLTLYGEGKGPLKLTCKPSLIALSELVEGGLVKYSIECQKDPLVKIDCQRGFFVFHFFSVFFCLTGHLGITPI